MDKQPSAPESVTPPPFKAAEPDTKTTSTGQPLPPNTADASEYKNNPFTIAIDGINSLFKYAQPIAILLVVLSVIGVLANAASSAADVIYGDTSTSSYESDSIESMSSSSDYSAESITAVLAILGTAFLVVFVIILIASVILYGISDVAAAAAANRRKVTFGEVFSQLFKRLPGYIGLRLLVAVKIFLWSLLFVIPGIIMSVRYSLAGTAYFARNMKATEAIGYSTKITKGGWMTTFASFGWFNLVTLGFIQGLIQAGAQAILFRQFDQLEQAGQQKPGAHGLSIAFTVLLAILSVLLIGVFALGIFVLASGDFS